MPELVDFRGNEIKAGDLVLYAPTNRYSGMVEARVLEISTDEGYWRARTVVKVQPLRESGWSTESEDRSSGRTVTLTNLHRIVKLQEVESADTDRDDPTVLPTVRW